MLSPHTRPSLAIVVALVVAACSPAGAPTNRQDQSAAAQADATVANDAGSPALPASAESDATEASDDIADAVPESGAGGPAAGSTASGCAAEIGAEAARQLADRCRAVSPATRPPCNPANRCDLIRGEIERACALFADGGSLHDPDQPPPAECEASERGG